MRFLRYYFCLPLPQIYINYGNILSTIEKRAYKLHKKIFTKNQPNKHSSWHKLFISNNDIPQEILADPDKFITANRLLTGEDTCAVAKVTTPHCTMVIKRFNSKNFWHKVTRTLRRSRAKQCWNNALRLQILHIATPEPLAIIEKRWGPLCLDAFYITRYIEGPTAEQYFDTPHPNPSMAIKLIKTILLLRKKHLKHRDTKANNFIIADNKYI